MSSVGPQIQLYPTQDEKTCQDFTGCEDEFGSSCSRLIKIPLAKKSEHI